MIEVQEKLRVFEESFELITESIDEPLFIINQDYLVEYVNYLPPLKLLGYSNKELVGKSLLDYIADDDQKVARYTLKNCSENKRDTTRLKFKHKLGVMKMCEFCVQKTVTYNKTANFTIVLKEITGVFEQDEKEEHYLKATGDLYQDLYENAPSAYFSIGPDKSIRRFNKTAENLLGYSKEELLQMKVLDLYAKNDNGTSKVKRLFKEFFKGKTIQDEELQMQKKNGELVWISLTVNSILDKKGKILESRSMVVNISRRKKAEQELKKIKDKLEYLASSGPAVIYTAKISGDYGPTFLSENVKNLTGYSAEDFVNNAEMWMNNIHPEDRYLVLSKLSNILKIKNIGYEYRFKFKDGTYHWMRDESKLITDEHGKAIELTGSWSDITWSKKSEEKLKHQAKIVENVSDAIISTDIDFNIITWNKAAELIYGWENKEVVRKNISDIIPSVYTEGNAETTQEKLFKEGFWKGEVIQNHKTGTPIDILSSVSLIRDDNGNIIGVVATNRDITERKKAEDKIKESEKRLKAFIEAVPAGISISTPKGEIIECNTQAFKIFGYKSKEEFVTTPVSDVYYDPKDREKFLDSHSKGLVKDFEVKVKKKDGTVFWVSIISIGQRFNNQDVFINSYVDITDRKEKEEELRLHSEIMTNMSEGVYLIRLEDLVIVYANPRFEEMFGYEPGEMIGQHIIIVNAPTNKTPAETKNEILGILKNTGEWHGEVLNIKKDGTSFWCFANVSLCDHPEYGRVIISVHTDITESKKAQQNLQKSENRYRYLANELELILDHIPGIVVYKDTENNLLRVNKFMADAHGLKKEDMEGNSSFKFYPKEEAQAYWEDDLEVIESKKPRLNIIEPWETLEGRRWVNTSKIPYIDEDGNVNGIIAVAFDITARIKAEQRLKESEEKFRTIAEQSSIGVIIQQGGFIKFANAAVSEIIEYPIEEINNHVVENLSKMVYEEDLALITKKIKERQAGEYKSVSQFELRLLSKFGKIKWVSIFTRSIIYLGGNASLSTIIDITDKKQVEEELRQVSRLKSDLLSRTSHELKTPLVSIKGYADLLLNQHYDALDFYTISILHEIRQGCSRLESLIKDLIESSKLESGEIELKKSEEDLAFLIRFCIKDLQGLLETRNHKLILKIQENMKTLLEKERIYDVVINLLSNAIKYTPSGGTIKINSEVKNFSYIISINDDGIGLTKDEISKIFQKFGKIERYGKGLDVVSEGSGLGLYISKSIIDLHGGNIWVESKGRGKGSTFFFSLPILKT